MLNWDLEKIIKSLWDNIQNNSKVNELYKNYNRLNSDLLNIVSMIYKRSNLKKKTVTLDFYNGNYKKIISEMEKSSEENLENLLDKI